MEISEYKSRMQQINTNFAKANNDLNLEYALSNKTANIGDIVTDKRGNVLVDQIEWTNWNGLPSALYKGPLLTAKLIPFKSGERGFAIESEHFYIVKKGSQQ